MNKKIYTLLFLLVGVTPCVFAQWTSLNGPSGAYVNDVERASDGSLYMLTQYYNTLYKLPNAGSTWQKVTTTPSSLYLNDILISGTKFYGLYFGTFYTSNDGITWTATATSFPFNSTYKIIKFGVDGLLAVYGYDGIFVSRDQGVTWTKIMSESVVPTGPAYNNVVATSSGDLYAYTNSAGIKRFPYPGLAGSLAESNWVTVLALPSTNYVNFIASGNNVYASTYTDLKITTNSGTTWTSVKRNIADSYLYGQWAQSPSGSVYYVNNSSNKIYSSTNPSTTDWTNINQPFLDYGSTPTTITFESASTYFVGSSGFGITKTTDTGATWSFKNGGLNEASLYNCKVGSTGNILQFSNSSKGYWLSTDNGLNWSFQTLSDYIYRSLKLSDGTIILYGNRNYKSTDATGSAFTVDNNSLAYIAEGVAPNTDLYAITSVTTGCAPTCTNTIKISKSTNKGSTWTDVTGTYTGIPSSTTNYISSYYIALDASNNIYFYIYDGQYKMYKITGTTCSQITTLPFTNLYLNNLFVSGGVVYAIQSSSYYTSSDGGTTWNTVGFSGNYVFPIKQNSYSGICVSRQGSLYITQDNGQTWNSSALPSSNATITDLDSGPSGFIASAQNSAALKNTAALLVDPTTLPAYINFNWQALNGPFGGAVSRLRAHPDGTTLFAIANGSNLWKYNGTSWSKLTITTPSPLTATTSILDVEVDAAGNVYMLPAVNPQKVYKSTDKGATWTALTSTNFPAGTSSMRRIEILSDGTMLAFGSVSAVGKIYRSTDNGANFTNVFTGGSNLNYSRLPAVSSTDVVATLGSVAEGIVISTDKGLTWSVKSTSSIIDIDPNKGSILSLVVDNLGTLVITGVTDFSNPNWIADVWKSPDNGTSWTKLANPVPTLVNFGKRTIALPGGEYIMTIQSSFDYYRSTDKGTTWTLAGNIGDILAFTESNYVTGSVRGVQKTTDGGLTFTPVNTGMPPNTAVEVEVVDNKGLLVGATSTYYSQDFGQNFNIANTQPAARFLVLKDSIIGYGGRQLQKSKDGGKTWASFGSDRFFSFLTQDAVGTGYYAFSNTTIASSTVQFGLFYSTDLITWQPIALSGLPASYSINGMVIDSKNTIYALVFDNSNPNGAGDVYKIAFGSASKISQVIGTTNPTSITYYKNKIYLYDANGAIYKSTDGTTWTQGSAPSGNNLVITNGYLFIPSTNTSLWLSRDDGGTWQSVGDSFVLGVNFRDVAINEYDGYAYAVLSGASAKKSGNIIMVDDKTKPVATTYSPATGTSNSPSKPTMGITFDEVTRFVAGKKIRIYESTQISIPVEVIDVNTTTQNAKTFNFQFATSLGYNKTYFIVIDAGAFTDIFGNAYDGITDPQVWRFTIGPQPDTQAPSITFAPDALVKNTNKAIQATINDNIGVTQAKVFYRSITKSTAETSLNLTLNAGKYEAVIPSADFGPMGIEYYFTASDAANNTARSPQTGYHYSYISLAATSPQIPGGLVGVGGQVANWRMISVPHTLADSKISTVFSELGGADYSLWRLITYKSPTAWDQYPNEFSNLTQGKGYFINVKTAPSSGLVVEGATTPSNNKANPFVMALNPGWNQIGNPYTFPIKWSEVLTANASPAGIATKLKTYNGAYVDDNDDQLEVFEGAFVLNSNSGVVSLNIPVVGSLTGGRLSLPSYDLSEADWIAPITLKMGNVENTFGGVGMHPEALKGVDNHDDFNPPHLFDYAEMSFDHPEHFLKKSTRDVVPTQAEYSWDFSIDSNVKGMAELTWDNSKFGANSKELFLYDLRNGLLIDMRQQNSYSFNAEKSASFKIYFGENLKDKITPQSVSLGEAFPNPGKGNITIPFTLPDGASQYHVIIEVYDMLGRKTSTLIDGQMAPGFYSTQWESGQSDLRNGLYTYRMKVVGGHKSELLNGKIILNQ